MSITQPLRDEHEGLRPEIERIGQTAEIVGAADPVALQAEVEGVHRFLTSHLIPHAQAEDAALYPVVGRVMGTAEATRTMSRDHVEIGRFTDALGRVLAELTAAGPSADQQGELRRTLFGLAALVPLHLAKEEEIYLPLLDERLTEDEAAEMFRAMGEAARAAGAHHD